MKYTWAPQQDGLKTGTTNWTGSGIIFLLLFLFTSTVGWLVVISSHGQTDKVSNFFFIVPSTFLVSSLFCFFFSALRSRRIYKQAIQTFGHSGVEAYIGWWARATKKYSLRSIEAQQTAYKDPDTVNLAQEAGAKEDFKKTADYFWKSVELAYSAGVLPEKPEHFSDCLEWGDPSKDEPTPGIQE